MIYGRENSNLCFFKELARNICTRPVRFLNSASGFLYRDDSVSLTSALLKAISSEGYVAEQSSAEVPQWLAVVRQIEALSEILRHTAKQRKVMSHGKSKLSKWSTNCSAFRWIVPRRLAARAICTGWPLRFKHPI